MTALESILTKFLMLLNIYLLPFIYKIIRWKWLTEIYLYTFKIFQLNHIVSLRDVYIILTHSILRLLLDS